MYYFHELNAIPFVAITTVPKIAFLSKGKVIKSIF